MPKAIRNLRLTGNATSIKIDNALETVGVLIIAYLIVYNFEYLEFLNISRIISSIGYSVVYVLVVYGLSRVLKNYFLNYRVSPIGKAVLITGCDHGFGYMLAKKLHSEGYHVFASCLFPSGEGAIELQKTCLGIHVIGLDVTNKTSISNALDYVVTNLGNSVLWAVVNNAGISLCSEIEIADEEMYHKTFDVNTFGVMRVTKAFLPLLRKHKGRVVTIASVAGKVSFHFVSSYSMSKFATRSFCQCLRSEMRRWGVEVVIVEPELYRTPIILNDLQKKLMDEMYLQCPNHVKLDYGEDYLDAMEVYIEWLKVLGSPKLYQVVDDMFDAVIAFPNIRGVSDIKGTGGIITGDETWVYEYIPETKQQSMICKLPGSPVAKKFKTQPSARKTMATVFWDSEGLLLCEFLEPRTTINSDRYCETLRKLHTAIRSKRPGRLREGVKLLHEGARPHTSNQTNLWVAQRKWEVLQHPPYSPDLAPSIFIYSDL